MLLKFTLVMDTVIVVKAVSWKNNPVQVAFVTKTLS